MGYAQQLIQKSAKANTHSYKTDDNDDQGGCQFQVPGHLSTPDDGTPQNNLGGGPAGQSTAELDESAAVYKPNQQRSTPASVAHVLRSAKLQKLAGQQKDRASARPMARPGTAPAAAAAPTSHLPTRRGISPHLTLSSVLAKAPALFDRNKVSAVEKFITHVDVLPERFRAAEIVYLSKNSLASGQSLSALRQFTRLRVLSLADNLIADWPDLQSLLGCEVNGDGGGGVWGSSDVWGEGGRGWDPASGGAPHPVFPCLEVLSLEGNPVAGMPHYRSRVILLLPQLKVLDGKSITDEERASAGASVRQEQTMMAVMMRNACIVHKMARTLQQLQLHAELFATLYGRRLQSVRGIAPPTAVPINPQRLLELWDYEGSLGHKEREAIERALRREVARMHKQLRGERRTGAVTWDEAFTQVLLAQQQAITQLLDLLHRARNMTAEVVRERVTGAAAVRSVAMEEEERRAGIAQDREALVSGLRDALQEVSPGAKARSGAPRLGPASAARSAQVLQGQASRVLFNVTRGSPTTHYFSPQRKLEIEGGRQAARSAASSPGAPAAAAPSLQTRQHINSMVAPAAAGAINDAWDGDMQAPSAQAASVRRPQSAGPRLGGRGTGMNGSRSNSTNAAAAASLRGSASKHSLRRSQPALLTGATAATQRSMLSQSCNALPIKAPQPMSGSTPWRSSAKIKPAPQGTQTKSAAGSERASAPATVNASASILARPASAGRAQPQQHQQPQQPQEWPHTEDAQQFVTMHAWLQEQEQQQQQQRHVGSSANVVPVMPPSSAQLSSCPPQTWPCIQQAWPAAGPYADGTVANSTIRNLGPQLAAIDGTAMSYADPTGFDPQSNIPEPRLQYMDTGSSAVPASAVRATAAAPGSVMDVPQDSCGSGILSSEALQQLRARTRQLQQAILQQQRQQPAVMKAAATAAQYHHHATAPQPSVAWADPAVGVGFVGDISSSPMPQPQPLPSSLAAQRASFSGVSVAGPGTLPQQQTSQQQEQQSGPGQQYHQQWLPPPPEAAQLLPQPSLQHTQQLPAQGTPTLEASFNQMLGTATSARQVQTPAVAAGPVGAAPDLAPAWSTDGGSALHPVGAEGQWFAPAQPTLHPYGATPAHPQVMPLQVMPMQGWNSAQQQQQPGVGSPSAARQRGRYMSPARQPLFAPNPLVASGWQQGLSQPAAAAAPVYTASSWTTLQTPSILQQQGQRFYPMGQPQQQHAQQWGSVGAPHSVTAAPLCMVMQVPEAETRHWEPQPAVNLLTSTTSQQQQQHSPGRSPGRYQKPVRQQWDELRASMQQQPRDIRGFSIPGSPRSGSARSTSASFFTDLVPSSATGIEERSSLQAEPTLTRGFGAFETPAVASTAATAASAFAPAIAATGVYPGSSPLFQLPTDPPTLLSITKHTGPQAASRPSTAGASRPLTSPAFSMAGTALAAPGLGQQRQYPLPQLQQQPPPQQQQLPAEEAQPSATGSLSDPQEHHIHVHLYQQAPPATAAAAAEPATTPQLQTLAGAPGPGNSTSGLFHSSSSQVFRTPASPSVTPQLFRNQDAPPQAHQPQQYISSQLTQLSRPPSRGLTTLPTPSGATPAAMTATTSTAAGYTGLVAASAATDAPVGSSLLEALAATQVAYERIERYTPSVPASSQQQQQQQLLPQQPQLLQRDGSEALVQLRQSSGQLLGSSGSAGVAQKLEFSADDDQQQQQQQLRSLLWGDLGRSGSTSQIGADSAVDATPALNLRRYQQPSSVASAGPAAAASAPLSMWPSNGTAEAGQGTVVSHKRASALHQHAEALRSKLQRQQREHAAEMQRHKRQAVSTSLSDQLLDGLKSPTRNKHVAAGHLRSPPSSPPPPLLQPSASQVKKSLSGVEELHTLMQKASGFASLMPLQPAPPPAVSAPPASTLPPTAAPAAAAATPAAPTAAVPASAGAASGDQGVLSASQLLLQAEELSQRLAAQSVEGAGLQAAQGRLVRRLDSLVNAQPQPQTQAQAQAQQEALRTQGAEEATPNIFDAARPRLLSRAFGSVLSRATGSSGGGGDDDRPDADSFGVSASAYKPKSPAAQAIEGQLLELTLEREELEKALIAEQGEARLLRQEVEVQAGAVGALEEALAGSRQELGDAQDALATQTVAVEEARAELTAVRRSLEARVSGLEVARTALEAQLTEARLHMQTAMEALARHEAERSALSAELARVHAAHEAAEMAAQLEARREEAMDVVAQRSRARRALHALRRATAEHRRMRIADAAAGRLHAWRAQYRVFRHWRTTVLRTRGLRALRQRAALITTHRALGALRSYCLRRQYKAQRAAAAARHARGRLLLAAFGRWRWRAARTAHVAAYEDPDLSTAVFRSWSRGLLRRALCAWREYFMEHKLPKLKAQRKAVRAYFVHQLRACITAWRWHVQVRRAKHKMAKRMQYRYSVHLLNRYWRGWQEYVIHRHRRAAAVSTAALHWAHTVISAWAVAAARSSEVKREVSAMTQRRVKRRMAAAWSTWTAHVRACKRAALGEAMAVSHHRRVLLYRSFWAWSRAAELAGAAHAQQAGVLAYQQQVVAVLRWRRLCEGVTRQRTIVERAVRMYSHRVVGALQRAVMQEWYTLVQRSRDRRHSACAAFVVAFEVVWVQQALLRAFYKWRGLCSASHKSAVSDAREETSAVLRELDHARHVHKRSDVEKRGLMDQLDAATAAAHDMEAELDARAEELASLQHMLAEAQQQAAASASAAEALESRCAALAAERDALTAHVASTSKDLTAARAEAERLRAELTSAQRLAHEATAAGRETQLKAAQQASLTSQTLAEAHEELGRLRREMEAQAQAHRRACVEAEEEVAEARRVREIQEAMLLELQAQLRAKDQQLDLLAGNRGNGAQHGLAFMIPGAAAAGAGAGGMSRPGTAQHVASMGVDGAYASFMPASGISASSALQHAASAVVPPGGQQQQVGGGGMMPQQLLARSWLGPSGQVDVARMDDVPHMHQQHQQQLQHAGLGEITSFVASLVKTSAARSETGED